MEFSRNRTLRIDSIPINERLGYRVSERKVNEANTLRTVFGPRYRS